MLQLHAVEALDGRLRLLARLEQHGAPALAAARVGVAHRVGLDDVANLRPGLLKRTSFYTGLEHLYTGLVSSTPRWLGNEQLTGQEYVFTL